ncbi:MAG: hypothetical protein ACJ796_15405 [Gemmatimonadaceae bacterium]
MHITQATVLATLTTWSVATTPQNTLRLGSAPPITTSRSTGDSTTLVILGVDHSAQLVARAYHPGYFRAFFERVRPAAICVERSPDEFARGDYYEFTYEIQHIAVPYARAHGIDLCPIDWLPSKDDERLAFGRLEIVDPPIVRPASDFQSFLTIDSSAFSHTLAIGESEAARRETQRFFEGPRASGSRDFPRRLDLYRTFMQAMRIRSALRAHAGQTVLVVVGAMHKEDIELILGGSPALRIVQPSGYGFPTAADAIAHVERGDLAAILSFNLLGVQSEGGPVDWPWVDQVLARFTSGQPATADITLLQTRHDVLTHRLPGDAAAAAYERLASSADTMAAFTFTGVEDVRRVDSYYDPFGNLRVRQRAMIEAAREWVRAGQPDRARHLHEQLIESRKWSALQEAELAVYWDRYIMRDPHAS